jgi:hypothetical protein
VKKQIPVRNDGLTGENALAVVSDCLIGEVLLPFGPGFKGVLWKVFGKSAALFIVLIADEL